MLDLHRLRLLRELERHGTMAAVAQALSYSPSSISQQLTLLEREAGVPLLERVGRGVRLTPEARILVRHTDAVLEQLERAETEMAASRRTVGGTLRVATFQSVLVALVPTALSLLAERHPQLRLTVLELEPEPALARLRDGDVDLVLGQRYPGQPTADPPGLAVEFLAEDPLTLALPSATRWGGSAPVLADLADVPWVMDPPSTVPGAWGRRTCQAAGFSPDIRFETPDLMLQAHLIATGHAVGFLPALVGAHLPPTIRLAGLAAEQRRSLFTITRAATREHPSVRAVRKALATAPGTDGPPNPACGRVSCRRRPSPAGP